MSDYFATIRWSRAAQEVFTDSKYSREHTWGFDGGATIDASPSPHIVPAPYSNASYVDPEESFVASLSSCHMLFFLEIAAKRKYVIDEYVDDAVGTMEENDEGKVAMTRVVLRPRVVFSGEKEPSSEELERMHHQSHRQCFIANSVKTEVVTEIR